MHWHRKAGFLVLSPSAFSRDTWLACSYWPFSDGRASRAIMSCPVRRCEKRVWRLAGDRSSGYFSIMSACWKNSTIYYLEWQQMHMFQPFCPLWRTLWQTLRQVSQSKHPCRSFLFLVMQELLAAADRTAFAPQCPWCLLHNSTIYANV